MSTERVSHVLVVDGHDGAGKTTLAKRLASELDAVYAKPFADTLGNLIAWLVRERRWRDVDWIARASVERAIDENRSAQVLVCDPRLRSSLAVNHDAVARYVFRELDAASLHSVVLGRP